MSCDLEFVVPSRRPAAITPKRWCRGFARSVGCMAVEAECDAVLRRARCIAFLVDSRVIHSAFVQAVHASINRKAASEGNTIWLGYLA
jgi:hypothetical protein